MDFGFQTGLLFTGDQAKGLDLKMEAPAIFPTSAFIMDSLDEFLTKRAAGGYTYNRSNNPNRAQLAEMVDYLEGGVGSVICAGGMSAITTTFLSLLAPGDHVLSNASLYTESMDFFESLLAKFKIEHDYVDMADLAALRAAMKPNTKLLYSEVLSNPMTRVLDVAAAAEIAHAAGALLVIDNTFTTGLAIKPLQFGADIVINSMTKFMNGHSDAVAGSVTGREKALMDRIAADAEMLGAPCDPVTAWLVQRGLYTIGVRVPRQMQNAAKLAAALEEDPRVLSVSHPSLLSHPDHALAVRQMGDNLGAMLVFRLPDDHVKLNAFTEQLTHVRYAPTLGGLRTTLAHPANTSHLHMSEANREKLGLYYGSIRLSVGLEEPEDLIADFKNALKVYD